MNLENCDYLLLLNCDKENRRQEMVLNCQETNQIQGQHIIGWFVNDTEVARHVMNNSVVLDDVNLCFGLKENALRVWYLCLNWM